MSQSQLHEELDKVLANRKRTLQPRDALVGLNYLFYLGLAAAIGGGLFYFYAYRQLALMVLPTLLMGALATMIISVASIVFAVCLGVLGALGRLSKFAPLRWLASLYVEVVRGTPLLVQLLLWYFGIGTLLSNLGFDPYNLVFQLMTALQSNSLVPNAFNGYFYGILGLSVNYGAYLTEVFRTGILSVDKGQTEAALSLGLDSRQLLRHIILPQAFRLTIPPLTNNFITLIQDSAFLSVLSVLELEYRTLGLALPQLQPGNKMFIFILGALLYLLICYPLSIYARYLERKLILPVK
ncbi:amino acid ABC transporter permease [Tengunoibacter tsumagoiensis]|uniref:ABC transmembrane type-1 domain-containing protein n=1 Tax=Tengunoibacter tsumagoiensis TaxID=2014871 RepID=A0A402A3V8_9CHLR|nr:amino acid ABC transporter permease [Tengunoibacter tsumagoiensis]GCE13739.1 hypothetical protein KTT_35980 [Tengunoibacter tsumagoiensis]